MMTLRPLRTSALVALLGATLATGVLTRAVSVADSDPSPTPSDTDALVSTEAGAEASTHAVPYQKLASALGTPELLSSRGPKDKSQLLLRFVAPGNGEKDWVKMTSINIAKVRSQDTQTAARSIIAKFKAGLQSQKHAKLIAFDESPVPPLHAFFEFSTSDGVAEQGIAYSPADGFVSVVQVAYRHGFSHGAADRDLLERIIEPK